MSVGYLVQQTVNAAQVSAFYALLAVSFVLIHAITRRINFAFGALAVWSSYTCINIALWLMLEMPGLTLMPLLIAGAMAIAHTTLAGLAAERTVIRPLVRESSLAVLVATLGLAIALEEGIRLANDSRERWLAPIFADQTRTAIIDGFQVSITPVQLFAVCGSLLLAGGLMALVAYHPFGRAWRACAQDLAMAEMCGVDVAHTLRITFAIASAYAAAAGVLIALLYGVASFHGGFVIGLKTLFVAVVGGLNSIPGVFLGAILLGMFETFWSGTLGPEYRDAAAFVMLSGLMIVFPEGLLGNRSGPSPV